MTETMPTAAAKSTETPSAPPPVALACVSKRFAATQALQDVSLDLRAGEIHALVGENGAGKSTIVKILAGIHQPDSGTVVLDGKPDKKLLDRLWDDFANPPTVEARLLASK